MEKKGKVYIIGGGCGDFELLTLKGKRCLESADCVIYDRLVNKITLSFSRKNSEKIYFGKENTEGGITQKKINNILVKKALENKIVVRLKGGDPFVFGRGGEEVESLKKNNIDYEIVPGITSAIAVPEYSGIPVTNRGISKSFHVFTGMVSEKENYHNFKTISMLEGTLIFLMGVKNLGLISSELLKNGKDPLTPVAVIEKGSTSKQKVIISKLETVEEEAMDKKISSPAIIVIGEVVNKREKYKWFENKLLYGKSILVTREIRLGNEFCKKIERNGGESFLFPMIKLIDNMKDFSYEKLNRYSGIMFSSPNGVKFFFDNLDDIRKIRNIKIGVVGEKTREQLEKYKIKADVIPKEYLGIKLAEEMTKITKENEKILVVTSNISKFDSKKMSAMFKRKYEMLKAYKNVSIKIEKSDLLEAISKVDYITFFSNSAVENFLNCLEGDFSSLRNKKIVSIGPSTSKKIKEIGEGVILQPENYTEDMILKLIFGKNNKKKLEKRL